jgi:hypothetical protein
MRHKVSQRRQDRQLAVSDVRYKRFARCGEEPPPAVANSRPTLQLRFQRHAGVKLLHLRAWRRRTAPAAVA